MEKQFFKRGELIYQSTAAKMLGLSVNMFKRLNIQPDRIGRSRYGSGPSYFHVKTKIEALINDDAVLELQRPTPKPKDYITAFNREYLNFMDAVPLACDYLFNLNRYCKHPSCSEKHKDEIYELKNLFINFLYKMGFCTRVDEHVEVKEDKICYECGGDGCERCYDTGIYRDGYSIIHYCFYFLVNEQSYCWHQPWEKVEFKFELTSVNPTNMPLPEIKEVYLPEPKRKEAKELIFWVLKKWGEDQN